MSDSDEEYGPITAAWGTQAPVQVKKSEGWDSLIDPNVKVGPNDVGSGNLHRRGTNFKPINEQLILAQRKHIQVPKKIMLDAIRETELSLGLPESKDKPRKGKQNKKPGKPTADSFSQTRAHLVATNYIPPVSSSLRTRGPLPPANGEIVTWGSSTKLVDTPFWDRKVDAAPTINASNQQDSKRANNTGWAKGITSDLQKVHENSTTGWMTLAKADEPLSSKKTKPAVAVAYDSNNQSDKLVTGNWGSVKAQNRPETRSTPPQSTVKQHDSSSGKTKTNGWPTPASRGIPAAKNKDSKSESKDNSWGGATTASSADWKTLSNVTTATSNKSSEQWEIFDQQQNGNEGVTNTTPTTTTTTNTTNITSNTNAQHIPSDKPFWLNSIPDKGSQSQSLRFSNPSKQRYSAALNDIPEPNNYRRDGRMTPLRTAPPPPPENSLLTTIKVVLSDSLEVFQDIRELDDPHQLAIDCGTKNNIDAPKVIESLTTLFTQQKELGLKKKNQQLRRRVQPRNYDNVYINSSSNFSTSYSRPSSTASSPTPFARKVYY